MKPHCIKMNKDKVFSGELTRIESALRIAVTWISKGKQKAKRCRCYMLKTISFNFYVLNQTNIKSHFLYQSNTIQRGTWFDDPVFPGQSQGKIQGLNLNSCPKRIRVSFKIEIPRYLLTTNLIWLKKKWTATEENCY